METDADIVIRLMKTTVRRQEAMQRLMKVILSENKTRLTLDAFEVALTELAEAEREYHTATTAAIAMVQRWLNPEVTSH